MINIDSIHHSLGSAYETNADIEDLVGWPSDVIFEKTGINNRYISLQDETSEYLALKSVKKIPTDILSKCDLIISVSNTQSNDFPTIAHFVHSKLELDNRVKCIGINAGCTGFVDAIEIVYALFSSNFYNQALIINSDTYSKFLHSDRSTRTLFSDGSLATIVSKDKNGFRIEKKISSSVPGTYENLIKKEFNEERLIKMNGPKVLQFAMSTVAKDLKEIIDDNESYVLFPHQAGKIVLDTLKRKLPEDIKVITNYENYGNLVSASIPNLIRENLKELNNNKIILSGFGVGLSHNAVILQR